MFISEFAKAGQQGNIFDTKIRIKSLRPDNKETYLILENQAF